MTRRDSVQDEDKRKQSPADQNGGDIPFCASSQQISRHILFLGEPHGKKEHSKSLIFTFKINGQSTYMEKKSNQRTYEKVSDTILPKDRGICDEST